MCVRRGCVFQKNEMQEYDEEVLWVGKKVWMCLTAASSVTATEHGPASCPTPQHTRTRLHPAKRPTRNHL